MATLKKALIMKKNGAQTLTKTTLSFAVITQHKKTLTDS